MNFINFQEVKDDELAKDGKKGKALKLRIELFFVLSMLIAIVNVSLVLYDVIAVKSKESPQKSTQSFTLVLLVSSFMFDRKD